MKKILAKFAFKPVLTQWSFFALILFRYNNMSYKVDEIAWDKTPQDTFTNAKGENVSFVDYYKNQYGLEVLDPKQPLLVSTYILHIMKFHGIFLFFIKKIFNSFFFVVLQVSRSKKKGLSEGEVERIICLIPGIFFH